MDSQNLKAATRSFNRNDIFRNLLHVTGIGLDKQLTEKIFRLGGIEATQSKIKGWRSPVDSDRGRPMPEWVLEGFFKGLFRYRQLMEDAGHKVFNFVDGDGREHTGNR